MRDVGTEKQAGSIPRDDRCPLSLPLFRHLPRLHRRHRRRRHDVAHGRAARQVVDRRGEALQDGAYRQAPRRLLHRLVRDVAGREVGEAGKHGAGLGGLPARRPTLTLTLTLGPRPPPLPARTSARWPAPPPRPRPLVPV